MRKKYHLIEKSEVKLVPKAEGILIKPKTKDPVGQLKGLAKDVWPDDISSVDLVKDLRRRVDFEAKQTL